MIRINEIMYGDFFRVNRDGLCIKNGTIVQVRGIDGEDKLEEKGLVGAAHCHPLDKYQFDGGIWVDYLDPIPLTAKILEKNFPEPTDGITWYPEEGGFNCHTYVPDCEINAFGLFKYVHQLQHALRLCEIEHEITL